MAIIKLFSPNGDAAGTNCYFLRNELRVPYDYTDVCGHPRTGDISVYELHLGDRSDRSDYALLLQLAGEEAPSSWPDIAQLNTQGLDPAMILAQIYLVLEDGRHKRRDAKHVTGGEAEDFVTGLSIVQNDPDLPSREIGRAQLSASEFRDIALHVTGRTQNPAIEQKIAEIRQVCGYPEQAMAAEKRASPLARIGGRDPRAIMPSASGIPAGGISRV